MDGTDERAAWEGHTNIVRFLISKGADTRLKNSRGKSALDLVRQAGNTAIIDVRAKQF
jgi:ankyrin repeat protein